MVDHHWLILFTGGGRILEVNYKEISLIQWQFCNSITVISRIIWVRRVINKCHFLQTISRWLTLWQLWQTWPKAGNPIHPFYEANFHYKENIFFLYSYQNWLFFTSAWSELYPLIELFSITQKYFYQLLRLSSKSTVSEKESMKERTKCLILTTWGTQLLEITGFSLWHYFRCAPITKTPVTHWS